MLKILYLQHQQEQYPILSCIACNYLAIQGSSVALEQAFLSGSLTTLLCNNLTPEHVEDLQLLKNSSRMDGNQRPLLCGRAVIAKSLHSGILATNIYIDGHMKPGVNKSKNKYCLYNQ